MKKSMLLAVVVLFISVNGFCNSNLTVVDCIKAQINGSDKTLIAPLPSDKTSRFFNGSEKAKAHQDYVDSNCDAKLTALNGLVK